VNKYDLVEELEEEGKFLDDYMQQKFIDIYARNNEFISGRRISAK
jgi:hypothetical protein